MKLLLVAGFLGVPVLAEAAGSVDVGSLLTAYGTAAPFAALCWWQMQRAQKRLEDAEAKIAQLQEQAVTRERDLVARVAPMFYDGARLYERGNERLAQIPATSQDLEELAGQVRQLIERMQQR